MRRSVFRVVGIVISISVTLFHLELFDFKALFIELEYFYKFFLLFLIFW